MVIGCQDTRNWNDIETYSPVINPCILRYILSVANHYDLDITTLDVKNAFLYGNIDYDVFLEIPAGVAYDREKYVFLLKKSLYGLRTSSRSWFEKLREAILKMNYLECPADQCVFFKREPGKPPKIAMLAVYVDDMILVTNSDTWKKETLRQFEEEFRMKVNDEPKCFLGVEFIWDRANQRIFIHQRSYMERLLSKFRMEGANPHWTPMEGRLSIKRSGIKNESTEFRSIIGALLFLARNTRPDISYPVAYLSRFQTEVTSEIFGHAKRILRYLIGTLDFGLEFSSTGKLPLACFADASFASAKDCGYESTSGYAILSYGNLITWNSKKQSAAQTSTAAAEYAAMSDASKEIAFLRYLNKEIFNESRPAVLYEDNTSAIHIAEGTETTESRFLMTRMHQVRKMVQDGEIDIKHLSGKMQLADILTKACERIVFEELRRHLVKQKTPETVPDFL